MSLGGIEKQPHGLAYIGVQRVQQSQRLALVSLQIDAAFEAMVNLFMGRGAL